MLAPRPSRRKTTKRRTEELLRLLAARQKQSRAEKPTDKRQIAESVEQGRQVQIVREVADVDAREAALHEERLMSSSVPDSDMAFDLWQDAALLEPLHEILRIRRVQIQRRSRLERPVNGAEDAQELVIVDVL